MVGRFFAQQEWLLPCLKTLSLPAHLDAAWRGRAKVGYRGVKLNRYQFDDRPQPCWVRALSW